jgi:hypothetical protein
VPLASLSSSWGLSGADCGKRTTPSDTVADVNSGPGVLHAVSSANDANNASVLVMEAFPFAFTFLF